MPSSLTPLLGHLWQKNRPLMQDRINLLERAALAPAEPGLREEALSAAHKMAGSLGMFGFPRGTDLARQIEVGLEAGTLQQDHWMRLVRELRTELFSPGKEQQAL